MNGHRFFIGCLVGMAILAGALAESPLAAAEKEKSPYIGPASAFKDKQSIAEKLATDVEFRFVQTPLKDVVSALQDVIGSTVFLNVTKLEEAAVSVDTPITLQIKGVQLRTALKLLLDDLLLSCVEHKQYIEITTADDAENQLQIRIYNVRELLAFKANGKPHQKHDAPAIQPATHQPQKTDVPIKLPADIMPQFGGQPPLIVTPRDPVDEGAERLIELIQWLVAPQSWDERGGPASVEHFKGLIIVSNTASVHEEVERFLNMLHEASGLPSSALQVIR